MRHTHLAPLVTLQKKSSVLAACPRWLEESPGEQAMVLAASLSPRADGWNKAVREASTYGEESWGYLAW